MVLREIKSSLYLEFTASNEDNGDTTEMAHVSPRSNVFGHDDEGYDSSKVIRRYFKISSPKKLFAAKFEYFFREIVGTGKAAFGAGTKEKEISKRATTERSNQSSNANQSGKLQVKNAKKYF